MNILDSHVLPPAVPKAPQELHLNCESLQQAARRRSQRRDAPIDSAFPSR
jgi:hypothetical protein